MNIAFHLEVTVYVQCILFSSAFPEIGHDKYYLINRCFLLKTSLIKNMTCCRRLYFIWQENVIEFSIEMLNEKWNFIVITFCLKWDRIFFFLHLFLFL